MKLINWNALSQSEQDALLERPAQSSSAERTQIVGEIIRDVRQGGDRALLALTRRLDGCRRDSLRVSQAAVEQAEAMVPDALKNSIEEARQRIEAFHRATAPRPVRVDSGPGIVCETIHRAITTVGLYVPAGSAPLPSTALMLGVPARLAGCRQIILCSPPRRDGTVDPAVLYAARLCGIDHIYGIGGAQAIAAMAIGTETVPRCDKLFGPGNTWVTEAKQQLAQALGGPAIDMPAGPSELLVIADGQAVPAFVAADLLSQAEHGPDSQVLLLTATPALAQTIMAEVERQLPTLPRAEIARRALNSSRFLLVESLSQAAEVSNAYAPEHLILHVEMPRNLLSLIESAGSIFLGPWSPESIGDYCSGTNHVLPTYGYAKAYSGVSVASFQKQITVQELTANGLHDLSDCATTLARAEGLDAHAGAIRRRVAELEVPQ